MLKLLIDECLSEELVPLAIDAGYAESSHVRWRKRGGKKDWELMPFILDGDWTFVTNNSYDFRGPPSRKGTKGYHSKADLHAGLVCLNWPNKIKRLEIHIASFKLALNELSKIDEMVNKCLEIDMVDMVRGTATLYDLPI
jgi:hypothetical protein